MLLSDQYRFDEYTFKSLLHNIINRAWLLRALRLYIYFEIFTKYRKQIHEKNDINLEDKLTVFHTAEADIIINFL